MKAKCRLWILAFAVSCQQGTEPTRPAATRLSSFSAGQQAIEDSPLTAFYGPERFTRSTGAPAVVERSISTGGFEAPFILSVHNGAADGSGRVSSATISVDGQKLLGPSDFSQQVTDYELDVELGATAALQVRVAGAPASFVEVSVAGRRSKLRVCPGEVGAYETLAAALVDAPSGATIQFCDGTHQVGVTLPGIPLILEAENPLGATLDANQNGAALRILSIDSDVTVEMRGLRFVNASGDLLRIVGNQGHVRITGSEFHPRQASEGSNLAFRSGVVAFGGSGSITIEESRFVGGDVGINVHSDAVQVLNSVFTRQANVAIYAQGSDVTLHAEGNTVEGCGPEWCVAAINGPTASFIGNAIRVPRDRPVVNALVVFGASFQIIGNTVEGVEPPSGKKVVGKAIRDHAISVDGAVMLKGNRVSGATVGIQLNNASGIATDNVVTNVRYGLALFRSAVEVHRNDFTSYARAFRYAIETSGAVATCNWWGADTGPRGVSEFPAELFTPFATEPIAGRPDVSCEP